MSNGADALEGVRNILYVTDFSQTSEAALPFAIAVARKYSARIHALHAMPLARCAAAASGTGATRTVADIDLPRGKMEKLGAKLADVPHETTIAHGATAWEVVQQATKDANADLVVLGTHVGSNPSMILTGSASDEIVRRSPVPVVSVGPAVREIFHGQIEPRRVLFATDFTSDSVAAAPYAIKWAQDSDAPLTLLHVLRSGDVHSTERYPVVSVAEAIHHLYGTVSEKSNFWRRPDVSVEYGEPASKISELAERSGADLIVLGARHASRRFGTAERLARNTVYQVVAASSCPVITICGPRCYAAAN